LERRCNLLLTNARPQCTLNAPPQHKYILTDHFSYYHGEAINPKHLSVYERCADPKP